MTSTSPRAEDPDLAAADLLPFGETSLRQAVANSNAGQSLPAPRYLPAWGPQFPGSLVGSKLEQIWPDGHVNRATEMVAFVPVEEVMTFYRAAVAASGAPAEELGWPQGTRFQVAGAPFTGGNCVLISDGSWRESNGSMRYKVNIVVQQSFRPGEDRW